jgi:hypothetical protein
MSSKQILRILGGVAVGVAIIAQFIQPEIPAPPGPKPGAGYDAVVPDARVKAILKRACADCHSNETAWPWYSRISPVSHMVANDVIRGRRQLNFSTATSLSDDQLGEIHDAIKFGEMPPKAYTFMHPEAKLSPAEADLLKQWALGELPAQK